MTITITSDIVEGARFGYGGNGPVATRMFKAVADAGESMDQVMAHASIPAYGSAYPYSDSGYAAIYALDFDCQPEMGQPGNFIITVSYSRPDQSQKDPGTDPEDSTIQVGSSVTATRTQRDNTGAKINITLTGQPDQIGETDLQVPETVVIFERRESANPLTKSLANTGRVNSVALGSGTYAIKTLLCLGIDGVSTDDGATWQVTYRFQYRPETWDATVVYTDPETDRPHKDISFSPADGVVTVEVYPEADFTSLSLPW